MNALKELQRNWEGLAQADPLWSICTDPGMKGGQWTKEDFFASGKNEVETVLGYVARIGVCIDRTAPALDFGCGVGRLTRSLAAYFPECCGVDISPTMIALAQELNHDLPQCRFLLNEDDRLKSFPEKSFAFVYSSIVLQHIPQSYSLKYLANLVRVLKPGGVLVFQLAEELRAHKLKKFRIKLALRTRLQSVLGAQRPCAMAMHCVKESVIRNVIIQNGARVVDVQLTNSCDPSFAGNLRYLVREPQAGFVSKQYCVVKD